MSLHKYSLPYPLEIKNYESPPASKENCLFNLTTLSFKDCVMQNGTSYDLGFPKAVQTFFGPRTSIIEGTVPPGVA